MSVPAHTPEHGSHEPPTTTPVLSLVCGPLPPIRRRHRFDEFTDEHGRRWRHRPGRGPFILVKITRSARPIDVAHDRIARGDWYITGTGRIRDGRTRTRLGRVDAAGYWIVGVWFPGVGARHVSVARLVFEYYFGPIPPGMTVDHIDSDKANNRPANLRLLSRSENARQARLRERNFRLGLALPLRGKRIR